MHAVRSRLTPGHSQAIVFQELHLYKYTLPGTHCCSAQSGLTVEMRLGLASTLWHSVKLEDMLSTHRLTTLSGMVVMSAFFSSVIQSPAHAKLPY